MSDFADGEVLAVLQELIGRVSRSDYEDDQLIEDLCYLKFLVRTEMI